jgi:hypothetical protein
MEIVKLGYANGWAQEWRDLYKELKKSKIENTDSVENIGNCLNEYSFQSVKDNKVVKVVYRVDSSG